MFLSESAQPFKDSMISVSDLSYLGICQIAFLFNKKMKIVTSAMIKGAKRHNDLYLVSEQITPEQMIEKMSKGEKFVAREITVADHQNGLKGRIDEIEFLGHNINRKNSVLIKDDKFSHGKLVDLSDNHRIQLASYAFIMPRDPKFKNLVEVVGGSIKYRKFNSEELLEIKVPGDQLFSWTEEVPSLVGLADSIMANKDVPKPYSFSLADPGWSPVPKETCRACRYNRVCNVGRKVLSGS